MLLFVDFNILLRYNAFNIKMHTAFIYGSLFMFELKKRQELDYFRYYSENQLPIAYFSDLNAYFVEMRKEHLDYGSNGFAVVFECERFIDDNSLFIKSLPEFKDKIIQNIALLRSGLPCDIIYDTLIENLKDEAAELGLVLNTNHNCALHYSADKSTKLNLSKKQENSIIFYKDNKYDFTLFTEPGDINYGTLIDHKIVSCSATTYLSPFCSEVVEISIATLEGYRQKGYAVSNVVSLAEYLLSGSKEVAQVKEVIYSTSSANISSQITAKSAGLIEISYDYYLFCKRI